MEPRYTRQMAESTAADGQPIAILSTFPSAEVAERIVRELVANRLIACANLVERVRSIYRWEGEVCDAFETLAVIKTTRERVDAVREALLAAHPYDCPEFLTLAVESGNPDYVDWLRRSCSENGN